MLIIVKIADGNIGYDEDTLKTIGLGSCVCVTILEREKKMGGMLHYMLPSRIFSKSMLNPYKYCDTGLNNLVSEMEHLGARRYRMEAKIVGGANMFPVFIKNVEDSVGFRNVEMAKKILKEMKIPILAEDTGNDYSRSVEFVIREGIIKVTSYKMGEVIY